LIDGEKKIMIMLSAAISNNKRKKLNMQTDKEEFPHLKVVMMKEQVESMQAVHNVSKLIFKAAKFFGIAGNKDKRGITFQFMTISYGK
jgi:tRNA(Glu) U13 pseudouridine synthase TruD